MLLHHGYEFGDGLVPAIWAGVQARGPVHYAKNVAGLLLAAPLVARFYGWRHVPVVYLPGMFLGSVVGSFLFGGTWVGASGGTFALLTVAAVGAFRRWPYYVLAAMAAMTYHQLWITNPRTAGVHAVFVGLGLCYAAVLETARYLFGGDE